MSTPLDGAIDAIAELRSQVRELTPWALAGALRYLGNDPDSTVHVVVDDRVYLLSPIEAAEIKDKIIEGQYGLG